MKRIRLTQGRVALVDDEDYDRLSVHNWCYSGSAGGYAVRNAPRKNGRRQKAILMHREMLGTPDGLDTDHRDRNTLNNQKSNLRLATKVQNGGNRPKTHGTTSKFKGVYFDKNRKKFNVMIQVNGKRHCLGRFDVELDAARAYDEAAKKLFGAFAGLNL